MINHFLENENFVDIWRYLHSDMFRYTWKRTKPFVASRLDYFLIPSGLSTLVSNCEIIPGCRSDHQFLMLDIGMADKVRGPGFWKLNCSMLEDRKFVQGVNEIIDLYLGVKEELKEGVEYDERAEFDTLDPIMRWELLKMKLINFAQAYSKEKAKNRRATVPKLQDRISKLKKRMAMINLSSDRAVKFIDKINSKLHPLKKQLDEELGYIARGAILRSKINWYQYGEHNSKYFMALEKNRAKAKVMNATLRHDGSKTTNRAEILDIQVDFYRKLYTSNPEVKFEFPSGIAPQVMDEQKIEMKKQLEKREIALAIVQMARWKTPGVDGLPADFYKMFYGKLQDILFELYNFCFESGKLYISARRGVITLLPKSGRDLLLVKSWRPISLLCCEYKIISKVITNRIKPIMQEIIHSDQRGFMAGRRISENIREAEDVIDFATRKQISVVMILVDFEKAFDRVEYTSLFEAFKSFSCTGYLMKWLKILFTDIELCTLNEGNASKWFSPTRGLFQGNPLGSFGFNTLVELLAIKLRQNKEIKGIKIGNIVHLLSQFVDDLSLFMKFNQKSWEAAMTEFSKFEEISGMKINYDKTVVYRLGSIQGSNVKILLSKEDNLDKRTS